VSSPVRRGEGQEQRERVKRGAPPLQNNIQKQNKKKQRKKERKKPNENDFVKI
jgi:hypothetical protein